MVHVADVPPRWLKITPKKAARIKLLLDFILYNPFASYRQISKATGIPLSTISRYISESEKMRGLRRVYIKISATENIICGYKYEVNPRFYEFIKSNSVSNNDKVFQSKKSGHFNHFQFQSPSKNQKKLKKLQNENLKPTRSTKPKSPDEIEMWTKNGYFRVHGFQRIWDLENFELVDDEQKWEDFAILINDDKTPAKLFERKRIGRNKKGLLYKVWVWSEKYNVYFLLQFKRKTLTISLPMGERGILIPWDSFHEGIEEELAEELMFIASRAIKVYNFIFNQNILASDRGWSKNNHPTVGYLDPDGYTKKVYKTEGGYLYIDGLGYWIDGSLKSTPELEFETINDASKFKNAIELLSSEDFQKNLEKLEKFDVDAISKKIARELVKEAVPVLNSVAKEFAKELSKNLIIAFNYHALENKMIFENRQLRWLN